jgi:hypothetical protein
MEAKIFQDGVSSPQTVISGLPLVGFGAIRAHYKAIEFRVLPVL